MMGVHDVQPDELLRELQKAVLRYVTAEEKLAAIEKLAKQMAAKAPEGDWGESIEETLYADAGRNFLIAVGAIKGLQQSDFTLVPPADAVEADKDAVPQWRFRLHAKASSTPEPSPEQVEGGQQPGVPVPTVDEIAGVLFGYTYGMPSAIAAARAVVALLPPKEPTA